jgi:transcriptional regulator with XRE-family HTH domain
MTLDPRDAAAIGRRIRSFREGHDLTQVELAKRCYVTQSAVSRWESGAKIPARRTQRLLADVLHTTRGVLFREAVVAEDAEVAA